MVHQQAMRNSVVAAYQANAPLAASHFGVGGVATPAFVTFRTTILTEGNWAENQTPAMVSDALRLRIVIHRVNGSVYFDAVPNAVLLGPPTATIHVRYNGVHYDSYTLNPL